MMIRNVFALSFLLFIGISIATAYPPEEVKAHNALVYSVAFSPDGKTLATAGFDNSVKLWDYATGKEIRTISGHTGPVYAVAFSKDGKTLYSSSLDTTI